MFWMAAPPIQWKAATFEGVEDYDNLTPCLASLKKGDVIFHFIDPFRGEKYFISLPNNQSKDTKMCYSRDGWCVMLQGERPIFLWNPLVEETTPRPDLLPDFLVGWRYVLGSSFSSSKDWVVLIRNDYRIHFIFLVEGEWHSFQIDNDLGP
ncbi:hypothetical protein SLEP1_g26442 [Rubroshorea leprosula]|nr:hypothetical protein SLEP1_g26442 [Rubroshorea leprosula]